MAIIREDYIGLYCHSGGYYARPYGNPSSFEVGQKPSTKHFGGSNWHGVGKSPDMPKGTYKETWIGAGRSFHKSQLPKDIQDEYLLYSFLSGLHYSGAIYTNDGKGLRDLEAMFEVKFNKKFDLYSFGKDYKYIN